MSQETSKVSRKYVAGAIIILCFWLVWSKVAQLSLSKSHVVESSALAAGQPSFESTSFVLNADVLSLPSPAFQLPEGTTYQAASLTIVAYFVDFGPLDRTALLSWIQTGLPVVLLTGGNIDLTGIDSSLLKSVRVVASENAGLQQAISKVLKIKTVWIAWIERGVVLPRSFSRVTSSLWTGVSLLLGNSLDCFVPRNATVVEQLPQTYNLLQAHELLSCYPTDFSSGPTYAIIKRDVLVKSMDEIPSPMTVGVIDITWFALFIRDLLPNKVAYSTAQFPGIRLLVRSGIILGGVPTEVRENLGRVCSNELLGEWSQMASGDTVLKANRDPFLFLLLLNCTGVAVHEFPYACPGESQTTIQVRRYPEAKPFFNGDFQISALQLSSSDPKDSDKFERLFTQSVCGYQPSSKIEASVIEQQRLGRRWSTPEDFHVCLTNCWMGGTGSRTMAMALVYNFSLELGFQLYFQRTANDFEHKVITRLVDNIGPLYEKGGKFNPKRCDYLFQGWDNTCMLPASSVLRSLFHFDLYHDILYKFFLDNYSARLRQFADEAYQELVETYKDRNIIPVYVRLEDQMGGKHDIRMKREVTLEDIVFMMDYMAAKSSSETPLYLVSGDKGVSLLKNRTDIILAEKFMRGKIFPPGNRLEAQFAAMDLSSRFKRRVGLQYSNNYYMQLAFHRINSNTEEVEYADVFSMRVYDYYNHIVHDFKDERFDPRRWKFKQSPYGQPRRVKRYFDARNCFKESLFGFNSSEIENRARKFLTSCEKGMLAEIL